MDKKKEIYLENQRIILGLIVNFINKLRQM